MLTIEQVARQLGVSTQEVLQLVQTRQLVASKIDGKLCFTQAALENYILSAFSELDEIDDDDDA